MNLGLDLLYLESNDMFLVLSLTEWDTFWFPVGLAENIIIYQFYILLFLFCMYDLS